MVTSFTPDQSGAKMAAKDRNWNNFRETFLFINKGWIKCQINVYCSKSGRWSACIWVYGKGEHSLASGSSSYRSYAIEAAIKKAGFEFDCTGDYSSMLNDLSAYFGLPHVQANQ
jgi:hypothetical protein